MYTEKVLEIRNFHIVDNKAYATMLLWNNTEYKYVGDIVSEAFTSEPVFSIDVIDPSGYHRKNIIYAQKHWAAMIKAAEKSLLERYHAVVFGNSIVPFFALGHEHLSYLLKDKEVEMLSKV